jgi:hypothetical protein
MVARSLGCTLLAAAALVAGISCAVALGVSGPSITRGSGVNWDEYEAESGNTNGEVCKSSIELHPLHILDECQRRCSCPRRSALSPHLYSSALIGSTEGPRHVSTPYLTRPPTPMYKRVVALPCNL